MTILIVMKYPFSFFIYYDFGAIVAVMISL